jgi:hypothetical protein
MNRKPIFIHLPKTGGTSINAVMINAFWQGKIDYFYRHLDYYSKVSNSADIFEPGNFDKYKSAGIFMMLRDPVDRLLSEYHFLKTLPEFISLLSRQPTSFMDYFRLEETRNYCIKFLLGDRIFSPRLATEEDLAKVMKAIDTLPIYVGIYEEFEKSLHYFSEKLGIKWPSEMYKKRMTLSRPAVGTLSKDEYDEVLKLNALDTRLYQQCLALFQSIKLEKPHQRIEFRGDQYDHVESFVGRFCLLEISISNKDFVVSNAEFLSRLHHMVKERTTGDGRDYVKLWNRGFVQSCEVNYPNTELVAKLNEIKDLTTLEATAEIAKAVELAWSTGQLPPLVMKPPKAGGRRG